MKFSILPILLMTVLGWMAVQPAAAQKIVYSEKDNDDTRNLNFEIIGKISGNFLIYKNTGSVCWITICCR